MEKENKIVSGYSGTLAPSSGTPNYAAQIGKIREKDDSDYVHNKLAEAGLECWTQVSRPKGLPAKILVHYYGSLSKAKAGAAISISLGGVELNDDSRSTLKYIGRNPAYTFSFSM
jgi:hypothetical protein